ncbi:mersacidin/lichenicidin family type 2 lantibiotic [Bacillus pseudomycoides]|nr:plantaricin C family lantibiotic [Bacillus pseudomycoides]MED1478428.1 plantaricin C family lantibiotic [Bacillus pseudomycoides]MED1478429.1 plantaricin C family lantibiotic [Bacillus pseudomycoides]MED1539202.1 plantaricin C family lantibiotic [Bacillus pseudomycoides]MED1539203.1 plantaricin C family lantibiotic [Bacillus pseudomycoides]MED1539204.1 plantaricin C family lantibiotic [Bacillus pseudomycoides]
MSSKKVVEAWKNPVLRSKNEDAPNHPAGEVDSNEIKALFGAGEGDVTPEGLSSWLGNKGGYCTLTKECMSSCN